MEGESSLLGSCCVLGTGFAWGRAGLQEQDGSAQRSEKCVGWGLGQELGDVEESGGRKGCWIRVGLLGRGGFAAG